MRLAERRAVTELAPRVVRNVAGTWVAMAVSAAISGALHAAKPGFGTAVSGGAFGPEASIIAIPVCLAAAALLALRVKQRRLVEATG